MRTSKEGLQKHSDAANQQLEERRESTLTAGPSSDGAGGAALAEKPPTDYKLIVGLCALVSLICSIDRASISVAIVPMAKEFDWTDSAKGAISSAFFVGYTVTNLVGGYVATRYSSKQVLTAGVIVWSVFTCLTPTAASLGLALVPLMVCRAAMGMGEGVAFPAISSLFSDWVPASSKSRSLGLAYSAGQVGNIVALGISPLLIERFGWPTAFWVFGSLGLTWLFAWIPLVPKEAPQSASARAAAARGEEEKVIRSLQDVPWKRISRNKPSISLLLVHCSFGVGPLVCLSWLPSYYASEWGLSVTQSSFLSGLPWACTFLLALVSGWSADALINKGILSTTATRKLMQGIASLGPATCLTVLWTHGEDAGFPLAASMLTGTLALGGFQAAGYGSNHQDLSPKYSGILFGLTNASASIAGATAVYLTGLLLDATDSWQLVWQSVSVVYCLGYAAFFIGGSGKEQDF